jgi:nicotinamidase-related amidase
VFNMLEQRDIDDVVIMGVHTNLCVLGRPFGIRQLVYAGKRPCSAAISRTRSTGFRSDTIRVPTS